MAKQYLKTNNSDLYMSSTMLDYVIKEFTWSVGTIASGGTSRQSNSIAVSGYTPIALVSQYCEGNYAEHLILQPNIYENSMMSVRIKNTGSGATNTNTIMNFKVLYISNN